METYQMLIGGQWVDAVGGERFETVNPWDGKAWATIPRGRAADAEAAVAAADAAFRSGPWAVMTASARGKLLRRFGELIAEHADRLIRVEVTDNGKLISEITATLRYLPEYFHYFGGLADKVEGAVLPIDKADTFTFTRYQPLGVCVAITAWNSPLLLAVNKLAPGLAAGNTFVLKPSEHTSASALELARLAEMAGFPPGVLNVVTGFGKEVGEPLVAHPKVAKIALTGSEFGGAYINQLAAKDFKHVTMELGGKSANIVFADADLGNALKGAVSGIFAATGQTCVAGSRLLVQRKVHGAFPPHRPACRKPGPAGAVPAVFDGRQQGRQVRGRGGALCHRLVQLHPPAIARAALARVGRSGGSAAYDRQFSGSRGRLPGAGRRIEADPADLCRARNGAPCRCRTHARCRLPKQCRPVALFPRQCPVDVSSGRHLPHGG